MQNLILKIRNSGLSTEDLSRMTGIAIERVRSFLNGSQEPTMSDVRKFSKLLKLSIDFLVSDSQQYDEIDVLFRKSNQNYAQAPKHDNVSYLIGNSLSLLKDAYRPSTRFYESFPDLNNTSSNARLLASIFRKIYFSNDFVSPLLSLPKIITHDLKIILFVLDLGRDIDGASAIINQTPFIFVSPRFTPRMLFTLAHELCHIIAHHKNNNDFVTFENIIELGRNRNRDESFANAFASELLLPDEGVGITLRKIRDRFDISGALGDVEVILLSRIYGVSFEVAAKRCEDIELLPRGGAASLYEELKANHGGPEKRAQELNLPDRPTIEFPSISPLLIEIAIEKVNRGELSLGRASEILSIPITDIVTFNSKN